MVHCGLAIRWWHLPADRPLRDTFGVHVEKADASVDGAYTMINREFAPFYTRVVCICQREEDLGIPGCGRRNFRINRFVCRRRWRRFCPHSETKTGRGFIREYGCFRSLILRRATSADKSVDWFCGRPVSMTIPVFSNFSFPASFLRQVLCRSSRGETLCGIAISAIYIVVMGRRRADVLLVDCRLIPKNVAADSGTLMTHALPCCVAGFLLVFSDSGRSLTVWLLRAFRI